MVRCEVDTTGSAIRNHQYTKTEKRNVSGRRESTDIFGVQRYKIIIYTKMNVNVTIIYKVTHVDTPFFKHVKCNKIFITRKRKT